jgi:inhibitor of cysteine peptidase
MRIALSTLLAAAFLASGCAMMSPKMPASISAADAGSAILLHPGQDLQLTLVSNHTTGYRWVWANPVNPVLAQVGKPGFKPSEAAKDGTVGVGGTETWIFRPIGPGQFTLKMEYRRPWGMQTPALETLTYNITVK